MAAPRSRSVPHPEPAVPEAVVEAVSSSQDVTESQPAPPVRPELVSVVSPETWRARRATLASPIPALLAASMGLPADGELGVVPEVMLADDHSNLTSRVDEAAATSLGEADSADYVVEVVPEVVPEVVRRDK